MIPRPETEELVDIIIKSEKNNHKKNILDIGTGSGCIAVTLSNHLTSNVIGIDVSKAAIDVAIKNNTLTSNKVSFITSKIENYIPEEPFDYDSWDNWTKVIGEKSGLKGKNLFMPLRLILTGKDKGPELRNFLPLLNKQTLLRKFGKA